MEVACQESTALAIRRASAVQLEPAVELLVASWPDGARQEQRAALASLIECPEADSFDLLIAERQGRLRGAVLGMAAAGGVASLWPPQLRVHEPPATATALHSALLDELQRQSVELVQVALHPHDETSSDWLERHGYAYIADLLYLRTQVGPAANAALVQPAANAALVQQLDFIPFAPDLSGRLAHILEATYEASLDCPRLDGWRRTSDVLASYRATGQFLPARWLLVQHRGDDVGCLLLTDHPHLDALEILYMGLAQPWRRRGWGQQLVQHAIEGVRRAGRRQLLVAVDRLNEPALRIYRRAGFVPWARRKILAQQLVSACRAGVALPTLSHLGDPRTTSASLYVS